jgi:sugar O-acyltransferase (sialic acid O-acetyltransferase NeuD family)
MTKTLAIIGSGDLGQQIAHYAIQDQHYKKVVFFDDFTNETKVNEFEILGKTTDILGFYEKKLFDEIIIGIGYKYLQKKKEIFDQLKGKIPFGKVVHSTSWVDASAIICEGVVIYPSCTIDAKCKIDNNTLLNIGCTIAHDTHIGPHCFLSPRVAVAGFVHVEERCILGINSTIIDNIHIVSNTQIGGGTVVIKNIDSAGLYVGNPSRFIRPL